MADQNLRINLTAFDKTQRAFASVRNGLSKVKSSIGGVRGQLAALGVSFALKQFADQIDELAKSSERLGLTVNQLQSLEFAAGQTGVTSQELAKGLERFSRSIGETANNVGIAKRSFEDLGVTVTNTEGQIKPTNELLGEVADGLKNVKDPAERIRIAFDLFGRSGTKLINTLAGGNSELRELQGNFNAITIQLTGEQAAAVEAANDGFDRLGKTFKSFGQAITVGLLPPLQAVAEFLTVAFARSVIGSIKTMRAFTNTFIDIANAINAPLVALGLFDEIQRSAMGQETIDNLYRIIQGYEDLEASLGGATAAQKEIAAATEDASIKFSEAKTRGERSADAIAKSFGDTFKNISMGTQSASDAFEDMAKKIIARLYDILVVERLVQSIAGFLKPMTIFGGSGQPSGRANGGSVQAGQPFIVGERGKELFVPRQSGNIVPNNKLGGETVVVNQTINVSTGVSQTVRAEIVQLMPQIVGAAKSGVLDAKKRGGAYGAAF